MSVLEHLPESLRGFVTHAYVREVLDPEKDYADAGGLLFILESSKAESREVFEAAVTKFEEQHREASRWRCGHDYDCCGCVSTRMGVDDRETHGGGLQITITLDYSRNY